MNIVKSGKIVVSTFLLTLSMGITSFSPFNNDTTYADQKSYKTVNKDDHDVLPFKDKRQLELVKLDSHKRAVGAHIQLKNDDEPTHRRDKKIKYNPAGWHNYKYYYGDGSKKAWLMTRGHLIGYQFSGLNSVDKNLTPETNWLNAGTYKGMDSSNQDSMLFYEKGLDNWLSNHPHYYLDYKVRPIYYKDELIPRQIELTYVGLDSQGKYLNILLGSQNESVDSNGITHVTLENVSPNAEINYANGRASNTVAKLTTQDNSTASSETSSEATKAQDPVQAESTSQTSNEPAVSEGTTDTGTTSGKRWEIEDGYDWSTRKGHSHIKQPGESLDPGYHWQV